MDQKVAQTMDLQPLDPGTFLVRTTPGNPVYPVGTLRFALSGERTPEGWAVYPHGQPFEALPAAAEPFKTVGYTHFPDLRGHVHA